MMSSMRFLRASCRVALFAFTIVVLLAPARALAAPRWCYTDHPDAIFCDDMDRYCTSPPGDPNEACAPVGDGCLGSDGTLRRTWVPGTCGVLLKLEKSLACGGTGYVTTEPFGAGYPDKYQLAQHTARLTTHIQDTFGDPFDAVMGTDANPLILDFIMHGQSSTVKTTHANAFFELTLRDRVTAVDDRAPTDYVLTPNCETACAPEYGYPREYPIICQQDPPPAGCPPIASAPHHASIAVGALSFLDKDPCHCSDPDLVCSQNEHLALFDGHKWWALPGSFTGEGDFMLRRGNNIIRLTLTSTTLKVEMTCEYPAPDEYSWCEMPRDYQGAFNTIRLGFGLACHIDLGSWECANSSTAGRKYKCIKGSPCAGRPSFDNVALYGGEGYTLPALTGACCLTTSQCVEEATEAECEVLLEGVWQGPDTTCAEAICCFEPFADTDADGDVDQQDFGAFQVCYTGPDPGPLADQCACFDRDYWGFGDEDVDTDDFSAFLDCMSGPTVSAADPACGLLAATTTWFYENFESYNSDAEAWAVWQQVTTKDLTWQTSGGWDGPKTVGGAKYTHRRHVRNLVPDIQTAPGGAGMTSVMGTDANPLVMECAYVLGVSGTAEAQTFWWDLSMGGVGAPRSPGSGSRSVLAFGAFPTYDGHASRSGLMYYDGLNWTELTQLEHTPLSWNFLRVIIKETTVSFMYWTPNMSKGMQTATVPRVYLDGFDTMGIQSDDCAARIQSTDAYKLSDGVFVP